MEKENRNVKKEKLQNQCIVSTDDSKMSIASDMDKALSSTSTDVSKEEKQFV